MATNFGKDLWKVTVSGTSKKRTYEFIEALAMNASHRWIPFPMIAHLDHIMATERQCEWLRSMCKSRMKAEVTFERVTFATQ